MNSAVPSAASPTPAFSLSSSGFTVSVTLLVNRDLLKRPTQTETLQGAVTGRNISYGFPSSLCSATPSWGPLMLLESAEQELNRVAMVRYAVA